MLPFTVEQFFEVFARYNAAVWPAQIAAYGFGVIALAAALRGGKSASIVIVVVLALFWAWTGTAYHWLRFAEINDAALPFGAMFIGQAGIFVWFAIRREPSTFGYRRGLNSSVGLFLIIYAAILYPLIGLAMGHGYPRMPMFGITPCPVTIFTFGLLLLAHSVPVPVLIIPVLWSLIGGSAAFLLNVPQDWLLLLSGPATVALLWRARASR